MPGRIEPKPTKGARAGVIDRLVDADPRVTQEPVPFRIVNGQELKESVRREVGWLLNTRCPPGLDRLAHSRSIVNYGVPDLATWSPQSLDDQQELARIFARAISEFEPRLRHIHVRVEDGSAHPRSLRARVEAVLMVGTVMEPVSFSVMLDQCQHGS